MTTGGYTLRNVARCWCFETSRCLGLDLPDQLPDSVSFLVMCGNVSCWSLGHVSMIIAPLAADQVYDEAESHSCPSLLFAGTIDWPHWRAKA